MPNRRPKGLGYVNDNNAKKNGAGQTHPTRRTQG